MKQLPNEPLECPYCSKKQSSAAEDYVIPGRLAEASRASDTCEHCGGVFYAEWDGQFVCTSIIIK
jgi:hypothetical protein